MANEANDGELPLQKKLTNIENKLKSIKGGLTKLTRRIESLELMSFQDQISKLGDEVESITKRLIKVEEAVALNEIDALNVHMIETINKAIPEQHMREQLEEYMSVECAWAREKARNNPTPLAIMKAFRM